MSVRIRPKERGSDAIEWSSSNPSVATVDSTGFVKALSTGSTTIRVENVLGYAETQVTVIEGGGSIRTAFQTTCGIATSGFAYCWGRNDRGQVAIGNRITPQPTPVRLNTTLTFSTISIGAEHGCGMTTDGPYCWGWYAANVLGYPSRPTDPNSPIKLNTNQQIAAIEANGAFLDNACSGDATCSGLTCVLSPAGIASCWDALWWSNIVRDISQISGSPALQSISVGMEHVCGIGNDGKAYCWGGRYRQSAGEIATGSVSESLHFQAISAGRSHTCAIEISGDVYCWGANAAGQLGSPSVDACPLRWVTVECSPSPQKLPGNLKFVAVASGGGDPEISGVQPQSHTCGITTALETYCWGSNSSGQLGNGGTVSSMTPVKVSASVKFVAITAGQFHTCGIAIDRHAYCWGSNAQGQLGTGNLNSSQIPIAVTGGISFR